MSKIAIISQAEQGVLIDISGCSSLQEAKQYLTSTLQVSSQFWEGLTVDLNLGPLVFTPEQVNEIQAIVSEVGVHPRQIYSLSPITRSSLMQCRLPAGAATDTSPALESEELSTPSTVLSNLEAAYSGQHAAVPSECGTVNECNSEITTATIIPEMEPEATYSDAIKFYAGEDVDAEEAAKKYSLPELWLAARGGSVEGNAAKFVGDLPAAPAPYNAPLATKVASAAPANTKAPSTPAVLMMKQTLRSGQRVCHRGHLVIIGDVNPGAELVADGDITVWGALRGMAHAGAGGNTNAEIRALKFDPIQLRIASAIARSPDRHKGASTVSGGPETARVVEGKIRISVNEPD